NSLLQKLLNCRERILCVPASGVGLNGIQQDGQQSLLPLHLQYHLAIGDINCPLVLKEGLFIEA
ncbi:MAG: hypothetical protein AB2421_12970, partial [Thermotaleaceae bacterium]